MWVKLMKGPLFTFFIHTSLHLPHTPTPKDTSLGFSNHFPWIFKGLEGFYQLLHPSFLLRINLVNSHLSSLLHASIFVDICGFLSF